MDERRRPYSAAGHDQRLSLPQGRVAPARAVGAARASRVAEPGLEHDVARQAEDLASIKLERLPRVARQIPALVRVVIEGVELPRHVWIELPRLRPEIPHVIATQPRCRITRER